MKLLSLFFLVLIALSVNGQEKVHLNDSIVVDYNHSKKELKWATAVPRRVYVLKTIDVGYRYALKTDYNNSFEVTLYPFTAFSQKNLPIDIGLGGGVSLSENVNSGFGKLYLAKEILSVHPTLSYAIRSYRLAFAAYADFLFENSSQRIGIDIVNTNVIPFPFLRTRLIVGGSYQTYENSWRLNFGISLGWERYREERY